MDVRERVGLVLALYGVLFGIVSLWVFQNPLFEVSTPGETVGVVLLFIAIFLVLIGAPLWASPPETK